MLARRSADLQQIPPSLLPPQSARRMRQNHAPSSIAGFRMSVGDDAPAAATTPSGLEPAEVKTLDSGFQRVLVAIVGVLLSGLRLSCVAGVPRVRLGRRQSRSDRPDRWHVQRARRWLNELGVVIGLSAALIYGIYTGSQAQSATPAATARPQAPISRSASPRWRRSLSRRCWLICGWRTPQSWQQASSRFSCSCKAWN